MCNLVPLLHLGSFLVKKTKVMFIFSVHSDTRDTTGNKRKRQKVIAVVVATVTSEAGKQKATMKT